MVGLISDYWSIETVLIIDGIGAAALGVYVLNIPRLRENIEVVDDWEME